LAGQGIASPGDGVPSPPGSRPPFIFEIDPPNLTELRLCHERRMIHRRNTLRVGSPEGEAAAVAGAAPGTVAKGPSLVVAIQRQARMAIGFPSFVLRRDRHPSGPGGSVGLDSTRRLVMATRRPIPTMVVSQERLTRSLPRANRDRSSRRENLLEDDA
jgi:hypothetical protein